MHIPREQDVGAKVDEALADYETILDDAPTSRAMLHTYWAALAEAEDIPVRLPHTANRERHMAMAITIPAWTTAEPRYAMPGTVNEKVGMILDGHRRILDGIDIAHTVEQHDDTLAQRQQITVYVDATEHYHAVAPLHAELRDLPGDRGCILRLSTTVVPCGPPTLEEALDFLDRAAAHLAEVLKAELGQDEDGT